MIEKSLIRKMRIVRVESGLKYIALDPSQS